LTFLFVIFDNIHTKVINYFFYEYKDLNLKKRIFCVYLKIQQFTLNPPGMLKVLTIEVWQTLQETALKPFLPDAGNHSHGKTIFARTSYGCI
jgi:hypothetical protein